MNVATVVEGSTDHLVLEAIILHLYPDATVIPLQPPQTHDQTGTGWRGVKRWCQINGPRLNKVFSDTTGPPLDLLIIHVDADIARQNDLQRDDENPIEEVQRPCPPIRDTIERLEQVIWGWLGESATTEISLPIILAIPSQDLESWIFASLFADDPLCQNADYECIQSELSRYPAHLLTTKKYAIKDLPTIARYRDGKIKKPKKRYRPYIAEIVRGWEGCCQICTQAQTFENSVREHLQAT